MTASSVGFDPADSRRLLARMYREIVPRYGCREDDSALARYRAALAKVKTTDFGICKLHSLYLGPFEWDLWVY